MGLSEDSALTALALEDQPVEQLVDAVFIRVLSRKPGKTEAKMFIELLTDGYKSRPAKPSAEAILARARGKKHHAVSWSNHLNAEATRIKMEMEKEARAGDPPTLRLQEDWRMRMEDMVWALVNSPEFVFLP